MSKADLERLLGYAVREPMKERPMRRAYQQRPRRTLVLRFRTALRNSEGKVWYVFWIKGERRKRYSVDPEAFYSGDLDESLEVAKLFYIIDKIDDGRMALWLKGLFHDKRLGLIK